MFHTMINFFHIIVHAGYYLKSQALHQEDADARHEAADVAGAFDRPHLARGDEAASICGTYAE